MKFKPSTKRKVVVFDFDGTLTTKDTLLEFIKFSCGIMHFYIGFLIYSPILVLMKLHLFPSWKAKQIVFGWFFKGMEYSDFVRLGIAFADKIEEMRRERTHERLVELKVQGVDIYVITASIDEWVRPYASRLGVKDVLGTKVEVFEGKLTGRFVSKNCYGQEKVNRLLEVEPNRKEYYLYAYGDSRGDKEMLKLADEPVWVK